MAPHFKRVPGPQKAYFNYEVTPGRPQLKLKSSKVLTLHQTHYRSYQGWVFKGHLTQPTVWKHWRIRFQFHEVHLTMLTITQHMCSIKKAKYTQMNTNESRLCTYNFYLLWLPIAYLFWCRCYNAWQYVKIIVIVIAPNVIQQYYVIWSLNCIAAEIWCGSDRIWLRTQTCGRIGQIRWIAGFIQSVVFWRCMQTGFYRSDGWHAMG